MLKYFVVSLLLMLPFQAHAEPDTLKWVGCGITKKAFMKQISSVFLVNSGTFIETSGGGATRGIRSVANKTADLGGSCRHQLNDEHGKLHPEEVGVELIHVAWDALVAIVHKKNPVDNISQEALIKIYDGEITNWKSLGGLDEPIKLITRRGTTSGVGHMFRRMVFNDPNHHFKAASTEVKSTGPLERKVRKNRAAMGMTGFSSSVKRGVKILSIDGIFPSKKNISRGAYPFFRPLYLTMHREAPEKVRKVLQFVLSPEGQEIISAEGTINLREGTPLNTLWRRKQDTW